MMNGNEVKDMCAHTSTATSKDEYLKDFGTVDPSSSSASSESTKNFNQGVYPKNTRAAKAYEVALDIRKFEIELLWKRAGYFWLLLAALMTALGIVLTAGSKEVLSLDRREQIALLLSCSGAVFSYCWAIVNSASKSWQRNWEFQVDVLEDIVVGPLYKTVLFRDRPQLPNYYSLSDVNIWIAYYFCLLFTTGALYFTGLGRTTEIDWIKAAIWIVNVIFVAALVQATRRDRNSEDLKWSYAYTRRSIEITRRYDAQVTPPNS